MLVLCVCSMSFPHLLSFFFNDTATTEIYTLSLHDALPIFLDVRCQRRSSPVRRVHNQRRAAAGTLDGQDRKSTPSELQSPCNLVCRLLLEKKKTENTTLRSRPFARRLAHQIHLSTQMAGNL